MAARHSLHLRFARLCPKTLRGVFSDAAAGIAVTSKGLNFPFSFRRLIPKKSVEFFPFDKWRLRLESESRKQNLWMFSTTCRFYGGQPVGGLLTSSPTRFEPSIFRPQGRISGPVGPAAAGEAH